MMQDEWLFQEREKDGDYDDDLEGFSQDDEVDLEGEDVLELDSHRCWGYGWMDSGVKWNEVEFV